MAEAAHVEASHQFKSRHTVPFIRLCFHTSALDWHNGTNSSHTSHRWKQIVFMISLESSLSSGT